MTQQEAFVMLDRLARGIAEMFGTNCETVINDLADPLHPILAIYNGHVSGREVGSTLDVTGVEQDLYLDSDVINLLAVTPSGQQTKSSTFSIKGEDYHLGLGINQPPHTIFRRFFRAGDRYMGVQVEKTRKQCISMTIDDFRILLWHRITVSRFLHPADFSVFYEHIRQGVRKSCGKLRYQTAIF